MDIFPTKAILARPIQEFLLKSNSEIFAELNKDQIGNVIRTQRDAWEDQINILKNSLSQFNEGHILFEFDIPRMGKRVDNIVIIKGVIFIIEFKVGANKYLSKDKVQTIDYALDLKNFHRASHDAIIVPILVATDAINEINKIIFSKDGICVDCILANRDNLSPIIESVLKEINLKKNVDIDNWLRSSYCPTPTIIEASKVLYRGHTVEDISRNEAGSDNLGRTTKVLNEIIESSKKCGDKSILLLTGVPGAGKTLAGLNLACERRKMDIDNEEHSVFLSGNEPLVRVLTESLAEDVRKKSKKKKADAVREVKAFINNVHRFRDSCLKRKYEPPLERIVIFDEAQRAWNKAKTKSFMKGRDSQSRFSKDDEEFNFSEPEFLISALNRHKGWTVIICLIGGGQEINDGEGGMEEWLIALRDHYPDWKIWISDQLDSKNYLPTFDLNQLKERLFKNESLHLGVSIRSFRSEKVSKAISALLDDERLVAKNIFKEINDVYPIKITRSVEKARNWLIRKARGSERYGLLVSSGGRRLKPLGIFAGLVTDKKSHIWFLNEEGDVRSSFALEDPATEFQVQGLELDWAGIIWDGDLIKASDNWLYRSFKGTKWTNIKKEINQKYKLNAYRVLLTRARQGMIIVVPEGDPIDKTRNSSYYDPTWNYLKEIGLEVI